MTVSTAYKTTAPADLPSGWRYCEPADGYTKTVEQCIGASRSSASAVTQIPSNDLDIPVVGQVSAPELSLGYALEPGPL